MGLCMNATLFLTIFISVFKPWKSTSNAVTKVEDLGKMQTKVTWSFLGKNKFPTNIFMLFYNMDKAVGKDFEEGLASLKRLLEKQ